MTSKNGESVSAPWGKTSRFTYKAAAKRHPAITKDEKEKFLNNGTLPEFKSVRRSEKALQKKYAPVESELLPEAITILNKVRDLYGNDGSFIESAYGEKITINRAGEVIHNYLVEHGIDGMMSVYFTSEMDCSGKMQWTGPMTKYNQPEKRNYSMWVKATSDNIYFRETGILNLTNHEIGTHFFRSVNDGLQPWYSNRTKFGLAPYKSQAMKDTEEGLASLNTAFESKVKYIWGPAMLYYIACMSVEMNFKQLFDHLSYYVADQEIRWKWVVRVKRGRAPTQLGGSGKDQCYFRGAVNILRNVDSINFMLLYSGKITVEDLPRVQRLARMGCIKTPYFLKDLINYRKYMKNMLKVNCITMTKPIPKGPRIKIILPKPPSSKEDKFNNGNMGNRKTVRKTPRTLMLEARQRIMSSQLLVKGGRRDSVEDKFLIIEHESDDDKVMGDCVPNEQSYIGETSDAVSSSDVGSPNATSNPTPKESPQSIFIAARRRSESFCSSKILEKDDSLDEDAEKTGCADAFCIPNHRKLKKSSPLMKREQERREIDEYFGNNSGSLKRPSTASTSRSETPISFPNSALQLVRKIPPSPKPNIQENRITPILKPQFFDITASYCRLGSKMTETNNSLPPTPTPPILTPRLTRPQSRNLAPSLGGRSTPTRSRLDSTSSIRTDVSKKSLKKNITVFFEDLIPFSKSRRKRVLPLPIK